MLAQIVMVLRWVVFGTSFSLVQCVLLLSLLVGIGVLQLVMLTVDDSTTNRGIAMAAVALSWMSTGVSVSKQVIDGLTGFVAVLRLRRCVQRPVHTQHGDDEGRACEGKSTSPGNADHSRSDAPKQKRTTTTAHVSSPKSSVQRSETQRLAKPQRRQRGEAPPSLVHHHTGSTGMVDANDPYWVNVFERLDARSNPTAGTETGRGPPRLQG